MTSGGPATRGKTSWRSTTRHARIPNTGTTLGPIYDPPTALIGRLQLAEAEPRNLRGTPDLARARAASSGWPGLFYEDVYDWWDYGTELPGLQTTRAWAYAQYYACNAAVCRVRRPVPDAPTDIYYQNIFDKSIKQKAVFGELTYELTDKWSVTGGARWFEYDRHEVDISYVPQGMPVWDPDGRIDPDDGEPTAIRRRAHRKLRHGQRHRLQVRDPVQVRRRPDGVPALQRGVPPRRQQRGARGRNGRSFHSSTSRTSSRTTRSGLKSTWFDEPSAAQCLGVLHGMDGLPDQQRRSGRSALLGTGHLQWERCGAEGRRDQRRLERDCRTSCSREA